MDWESSQAQKIHIIYTHITLSFSLSQQVFPHEDTTNNHDCFVSTKYGREACLGIYIYIYICGHAMRGGPSQVIISCLHLKIRH